MKLLLDNLPPALQGRRETLARCIEAFARVRTVREVYLFGSHARGDARPDSDVDLCNVAEGAETQLQTAREFRRAIRGIRPKPSFTLVPIAPQRLEEKKAIDDHFLPRSCRKESSLPRKTDSNNPSDWISIAESDLEGVRALARQEISYSMSHSKLAEILENPELHFQA